MNINFDEWLPDREDLNTPLRVAENVLPDQSGYGSFPVLENYNTVLNLIGAKPNSLHGAKINNGVDVNFVGAQNAVYGFDAVGGIFDLTTTLSITTSEIWDFTTFSGEVVAVNPDVAPIASPLSVFSNFAALTGSPPDGAKAIGRCRDFLVLGNTLESAVNHTARVRWSGFNNANTWGSDASTQADFQDLQQQYGAIQRIIPGTTAYILQESAITRMSYVGPPVIFRFDTVAETSGTTAAKSVAWTDDLAFFYSRNGFQSMDLRSGKLLPIGSNRVDDWFRDSTTENDVLDMQGGIDRRRKMVFWVYNRPAETAASGNNDFNTVIVYSWETNKWSYGVIDTIGVGQVEINDASTINESTSLGILRDQSTAQYYLAVIPDNDTANPLDARFQTGLFGSDDGLFYLDGARPLVGSSGVPLTSLTTNCFYKINRQTDADAGNTGDVEINSIGRCDFRVSARYARLEMKTQGPFRRFTGVEVDPQPSGQR